MSTEGITLIYSNNGTVIGANYYAYKPSVTAGWAFVGLFGVSTALHLGFIFRGKSAFFIPLIIGGIS